MQYIGCKRDWKEWKCKYLYKRIYVRFELKILGLYAKGKRKDMKYFMGDDSIKELTFSSRTYNTLLRAGIATINQLLELSMEDLGSIKNLGKKGYEEIEQIIRNIKVIDKNNLEDEVHESKQQTFLGDDGKKYIDMEISELNFSNRAYNCLKNNGINYLSQLLEKTEEELFQIHNMGKKSVLDVLEKVKKVQLVQIDSADNPEATELKTCLDLVNEITEIIPMQQIKDIYPKLCSLVKNIKEINTVDLYDITIVSELYNMWEVKEGLRCFVFRIIEKKENGISERRLFEQLPNCLKNKELFHQFMLDMIQSKCLVLNEENLYEKRYPTVLEYVQNIEDERASRIILFLLEGMTLEDVGKKYNVSRERIRQIKQRYVSKAPRLQEDKYAYIFQKYNISREDFILGFDNSVITYNYLSMAYKRGDLDVEQMVEDSSISEHEKVCVEKIIYKNYVTLNGERVLKTRADLSEYLLKTIGKKGITFEEFKELYQMLLEDLGLENNCKFTLMDRGYENKMAVSNHVLWKHHKKMRYYNIDSYEYDDLFKTLNLSQYNNIEISTLKLFRENPEVMREYDIQDEYELHNLLKKICPKDMDISFKRMPNIEFGKADRDKQVMDLLLEMAPVSNTDLADEYEKRFGVLASTALANYFKKIYKYFFNGIYKIDAPRLPEIMVDKLRECLDEEFYLLSDIRKIYNKIFLNADQNMLNPFTIKELGFRVYSNYVVSNKYTSAVEYFRTILTANDLIDASQFPEGMLTVIAYMSEVYRLKAGYEIIEYRPQNYINIRKLRSVGMGRDVIKDYCKSIYAYSVPTYFTVHSLQRIGFEHELDDLGFEEWFYSSILVEDKEHFSYRRVGKNRLFKKGQGEVCLSDFIEWIIYSKETLSMDVYDLSYELLNEYNISIEIFKLVEATKENSLYYDRITEKIYADYEVYFDEI